MPATYETAYPQLQSNYTEQALHRLFSPTEAEVKWARRHTRERWSRLGLLTLLKSFGTEEAAKYALELIQDNVPFSWIQMNNYVPRFAELARDDMDKIQETAARLKDLTR